METRMLRMPSAGDELAASTDSHSITFAAVIAEPARASLARMFRDPNILEKGERMELVRQLREMVAQEPKIPELRVLLGMALCVNFEAQEALEHLRESVRQAPDSFIARLKFGELLMRLRICGQAADETFVAAQLACNPFQSELARRQAATIRTMQREGIQRGGYGGLVSALDALGHIFTRTARRRAVVAMTSR